MAWQGVFETAALQRDHAHGVRRREPLTPAPGMRVTDGQRHWVNFSGNDYLGLAAEREIAHALAGGASRYGTGSGA